MKEILIQSNIHGTCKVLVDDEDYESLNKFKWSAAKKFYTIYAIRNTPWIRINGKWRHTSINMHRTILAITDSKIHIDNRDGNGLNNQKSNLRTCTPLQNQANKNKWIKKSSSYKGVSKRHGCRRWRSRITFNKKTIDLGLFDSEISAYEAYNKKAIELY
jgi:hypothetical protein